MLLLRNRRDQTLPLQSSSLQDSPAALRMSFQQQSLATGIYMRSSTSVARGSPKGALQPFCPPEDQRVLSEALVGAGDNQNLLRGPRSLPEAPHQGCRLTYEDAHYTTSSQHKCGKRYISNRRGTEEHCDINPIFKKHVMMRGSTRLLSHRKKY